MSGAMVTTTNGMVWNGTAWVTSTTAAAPAPPAQQPPQQLVHKYTQIYHEWIARKQEFEKRVSQLPVMSKERADAQQHVDWSQQYADAASRAAHHYHNTPHLPVAFALPEAPSPMAAPVASAPVAVQQQPAAAATSEGTSSEGSLKRYVHRCLQQCTTPEQKATGQKIVEQVIAKALQNGTLHSTNWDVVGLPAEINNIVGATARPPPPPPPPRKKQKVDATTIIATSNNNSNNYSSSSYYYNGIGTGASPYGPASSFPQQQQQNPYQTPFSQNAGGGGYYGPSGTTPAATNTNSFYPSQQQQQQQPPVNYGKYGPSTSSSATPDTLDYNNGTMIAFGKNNKYVNPNSKKNKKKPGMDGVGFKKSSQKLAQRANRFSGPGGNHDVRSATARGIDDRYMGKGVIGGNGALDEHDYEHMKVKGTCQVLEKQYLRLTAPPKPELVRPLPILQQHLKNLKAEWALGEKSNGSNNMIQGKKRRDYLWFCAEMKALRQDLTVQHIRNAFTCEVYETHARMALQEGDLNEFNQAQTQLEILYDLFRKETGGSDGTNKKSKVEVTGLENENEFVAYRLIYFVMLTLNPKYTGGSSDMLRLMLSLTASQQRDDAAIQHALQVRAAVADMDYHKFFLLNKRCPNLGGKLTNLMVPTIRHQALQRICKAYRPLAEVKYVLQEIGLMSDTTDSAKALKDGKTFLLSCGCILSDDGVEINTKESIVRESDLQAKQSLI